MDHEATIRALIERDVAASLMNTTKWMEALDALRPLALFYRIKLLTHSQPSSWQRWLQGGSASDYLPRGYIEGCGYSPTPVLEIEWLEVQPAGTDAGPDIANAPEDPLTAIETALSAHHIPFRREGDLIRITGHIRR